MRAHVSITIGEFDHPRLDVDDTMDDEPWLRIQIDELTTISGPVDEVRRWIEELSVKAAML